jgi:hypothetical protein
MRPMQTLRLLDRPTYKNLKNGLVSENLLVKPSLLTRHLAIAKHDSGEVDRTVQK